jgi:hypothetical protein
LKLVTGRVVGDVALPLTPGLEARKPAPKTTLETVTTAAVENRCEALTISDIPP